MKQFDFQLYSDIHIEFSKTFPKIKPNCDYLILAGDIGKINTENFQMFFDYCSQNWKKVFYILGNHEYYHSSKTYDKLNGLYKEFFKQYTNVILLDNSIYEIDDELIIIGSTLWSMVSHTPYLNDFNKIYMYNEDRTRKIGITMERFQELHKESKKYILEQVNNNKNKKIIIITHFPPSKVNTSHPKYNNQEEYLKNYYASDFIEEIPEDNNILLWCYGHTHYSNDMKHESGIRLLSNQVGYIKEGVTFNETGKFTLEY